MRLNSPVAMIRKSVSMEYWYYYADVLGSTRLLTNAAGVFVSFSRLTPGKRRGGEAVRGLFSRGGTPGYFKSALQAGEMRERMLG